MTIELFHQHFKTREEDFDCIFEYIEVFFYIKFIFMVKKPYRA